MAQQPQEVPDGNEQAGGLQLKSAIAAENNGVQQDSSPLDSVRATPEYKAAWDVEVWKLMQQRRYEKELREAHKKAVETMKASVAAKDKEAQTLIDRKLKEISDELKKVSQEASSQEQRKKRLIDAERELKKQHGELTDHKKKVETEAEELVKRVKAEFAHRLTLEAEKVKGLEGLLKKSEERLSDSQKEYQKLWQEFADFKAAQLSGGVSGGGVAALHWKGQMETLKAQHASEIVAISERHERRFQDLAVTHDRKIEQLHRENKKLSTNLTQKREQFRTVTQDLAVEKEKCRDIAKELSLVREQLHDAKKNQNTGLAKAKTTLGCRNPNEAPAPIAQKNIEHLKASVLRAEEKIESSCGISKSSDVKSVGETERDLTANISRWEKEKLVLIETSAGAYTEESPVIQDLTRRILAARTTLQKLLK